jgi:hypothetical protein
LRRGLALGQAGPAELRVDEHRVRDGPQLLADVTQYLTELRDEAWKRQDSAMSPETIVEEVRELLIARHPDWDGQEWIEPGVGCLCAEHAA